MKAATIIALLFGISTSVMVSNGFAHERGDVPAERADIIREAAGGFVRPDVAGILDKSKSRVEGNELINQGHNIESGGHAGRKSGEFQQAFQEFKDAMTDIRADFKLAREAFSQVMSDPDASAEEKQAARETFKAAREEFSQAMKDARDEFHSAISALKQDRGLGRPAADNEDEDPRVEQGEKTDAGDDDAPVGPALEPVRPGADEISDVVSAMSTFKDALNGLRQEFREALDAYLEIRNSDATLEEKQEARETFNAAVDAFRQGMQDAMEEFRTAVTDGLGRDEENEPGILGGSDLPFRGSLSGLGSEDYKSVRDRIIND